MLYMGRAKFESIVSLVKLLIFFILLVLVEKIKNLLKEKKKRKEKQLIVISTSLSHTQYIYNLFFLFQYITEFQIILPQLSSLDKDV